MRNKRKKLSTKTSRHLDKQYLQLLAMGSPCILFVIIFGYVPLAGWIYAFFDYKPGISLGNSPFVGLKYFVMALSNGKELQMTLRNTLVLSGLGILTTPLPIIFAIMLSEVRAKKFGRIVQTVTTLPNFISWILVFSIAYVFCFVDDGLINNVLLKLNIIKEPINYLAKSELVWPMQTFLGIWKTTGWTAIIYLAAITGVDPGLYEAAKVDGASRLQCIWHITVPGIMPLINGGNLIALDDLIEEYGQDILKDCATRVQFSKDYYSMGTGKLYVLPGDAGYNIQQIDSYMGLRLRWDYYKELGCPQYNDYYDVLDILKQMQEAHPTTEDGKKVYGMSGFLSDWNLWSYIVWPEVWQGCFSEYSGFVDVDCVTNEATSYITNPDSTLWNGARIWNMANRMGILDPDSFTQKSDQCLEKYSAGRVLSGWVGFMTSGFDYNMQQAGNEDIGFINMQPPAGTTVYYSGESKVVGKSWALWGITSKCEHPEKAMELLNILQSFDGNMMLYNGIEGRDWEINENGVPVITESSFELRETDSEYLNRTGIGKYTGWCSLAGGYIHPEYNVPLNLLFQEETFKDQLTPLQQDYCEYYDLDYPAQWLYEDMEDITVHEVVAAALPDTPDDIIRTDDAIMEYLKTELLQLVMNATTDEEFEAGREKILEELYDIGLQDSLDFWLPAYAETAKIAQQYGE